MGRGGGGKRGEREREEEKSAHFCWLPFSQANADAPPTGFSSRPAAGVAGVAVVTEAVVVVEVVDMLPDRTSPDPERRELAGPSPVLPLLLGAPS